MATYNLSLLPPAASFGWTVEATSAERLRYAALDATRERGEVVMHMGKRLLLSVVFLAVPSFSAGQDEEFKKAMEEEQLAGELSRKYLAPVTSFGYIYANRYHSGRDTRENVPGVFFNLIRFVYPSTSIPSAGMLPCDFTGGTGTHRGAASAYDLW